MAYKYDIFISYRRDPETYRWIKEHFVPLLQLRVELELGRKPEIYVDDQIESGASWPISLGRALGNSRVLMALWTGNYLASTWCTIEFTHMLAREQATKRRTVSQPHGLVIPAFIHDGDKFPPALRHIEYFEIQRTFNVRMARNSTRAEELDSALADQAKAIATCIESAPTWRKSWGYTAASTLFGRFHQRTGPLQTTVPRFTAR